MCECVLVKDEEAHQASPFIHETVRDSLHHLAFLAYVLFINQFKGVATVAGAANSSLLICCSLFKRSILLIAAFRCHHPCPAKGCESNEMYTTTKNRKKSYIKPAPKFGETSCEVDNKTNDVWERGCGPAGIK